MGSITLNNSRPLQSAGPLISLTILGAALWYMYNTLQAFDLRDIFTHFLHHSMVTVSFAVVLAGFSYLAVTGYDVLALAYLRRRLPYSFIAPTAFIASVFGNNLGFALLTGTSIRYRMYSRVGLNIREIAVISSLCALTTMLGMAMLFSLSTLLGNSALSESAFGLPHGTLTLAGGIILLLMLTYIGAARFHPFSIRLKQVSILLPSSGIVFGQVGIATVNLLIVGTLIYYLVLPFNQDGGYLTFIGVFAVAIIAGSASNVPGGIGVFESVLMAGLPDVRPDALLGCVLLFRCVYYLLPLILASTLLLFREYSSTRIQLHAARIRALDWLASSDSQIMAVLAILAGTLLLFTYVIPPEFDRLSTIFFVPLPFLELAHLTGVASGTALLLAARGIWTETRSARRIATLLVLCGIAASLVRSFDLALTAALAFILLTLGSAQSMPQRTVQSSASVRFPVEWVLLQSAIILSAIWIGMFAYKNIPYSPGLWWTFAHTAEYPRFLRGALVMTMVFSLGTLHTAFGRSTAEPDVIDSTDNPMPESLPDRS